MKQNTLLPRLMIMNGKLDGVESKGIVILIGKNSFDAVQSVLTEMFDQQSTTLGNAALQVSTAQ